MVDYYNRFDRSKNYKKLMFRAGKGLQSAELNEIQSIYENELNVLAETLFGDGTLLKGGEISIVGDTLHIKECQIYAKNFTHTIESSSIVIPQIGPAVVGVAIKETEVTEMEDPTLRDPAPGTRNFNEPGAGRLKVDSRWILESDKESDDYFYPIHNFMDGILQSIVRVAPELEGARDMIARYDNASSGSYVIEGLDLSYIKDDNATERHLFTVSAGQGHVEGYEVEFMYARGFDLPFNKDKKSVTAEPSTFTGNGEYSPRNTPIASVTRLLGVKRTTKTITHENYLGSKDLLPNTPVVEILKVTQAGVTYKEGVDYILKGDRVDWSLNGNEPSPGSTYSVEYRYTDTSMKPVISEDRKTVTINGLDSNTLFYLTYDYYIPRIDRVLLTRTGEFKILTGVPDSFNPQAPKHTNLLSLATIKVLYGSKPEVKLDYYKAFKMSHIQDLFNEIVDIKYNVARLALTENIKSIDPSTVKKNTFVDPFLDDDMRDKGISQTGFISQNALIMNTDWDVDILTQGEQDFFLPNTGSTILSNESQSKSRKVNEFIWQGAPNANMVLTPNNYRWVTRVISRTISGSSNGTTTNTYNLGETVIVPTLDLTVNGGKYNAGETVEIKFDGFKVAEAIADKNGFIVNKSFQIPDNTTSGSKSVKFLGLKSGVTDEVVFTATPLITERTTTVAPPPPPPPRRVINVDPLAQTFSLTKEAFIESIDIRVTTLPDEFLGIALTETSVGIPDSTRVIDVKEILKADLTVNTWSNFKFTNPVYLNEGREYAFIVYTTDATAAVGVSELGQYDIINKRWITNQSFNNGVLLSSSNANTWSPIQKEDMTFKINKAVFGSDITYDLGTTTVTNKTDLMILADLDLYAGTVAQFEATLLNRNNEIHILNPYTPLAIGEYTGDISVSLSLSSSNANLTPVVNGVVQLASGIIDFPSSYNSRQFSVDGTSIKVYIEMLEPAGSSVKVFYESSVGVYTEMTRNPANATSIGDGYVDMEFRSSTVNINETRIQIVLDTTDKLQRPVVKNLRAFVI